MKNLKVLKKLVMVMLGIALMVVLSGNVFAADDDLFTSVSSGNNTEATTTNNTTGNDTNSAATNNTTSNTANSSLTTNSTSNTNTTRNTSSNTTNNTTSNANRNVTNTLAKTGLSNTGSIVALVVVVCGISAVYSFKKVNDYKKI